MIKNTELAWNQFLNPDVLRTNLILASLYIAYYEILKDSLVERIKDFLATEWTEGRPVASEKYKREVLARNKSPVYGSLAWLQENGAIDISQIKSFERIKSCRNELAHELKDLITKGVKLRHLEAFRDLIDLLEKIEVWWIVNVEIQTNPDLVGKEINKSEIIPGPIIGLRVLLDVALGDEEQSRFYYGKFVKRNRDV